eukprot:14661341-Alexandrium_andersonii.AAC.1
MPRASSCGSSATAMLLVVWLVLPCCGAPPTPLARTVKGGRPLTTGDMPQCGGRTWCMRHHVAHSKQ